jgi:hypothetical protein
MTNSILEITESEYLIKLNKSTFDLSFIRSLLKMVEVAKPSADDYSSIPERYLVPSLNGSSEPEYFSYIEEK